MRETIKCVKFKNASVKSLYISTSKIICSEEPHSLKRTLARPHCKFHLHIGSSEVPLKEDFTKRIFQIGSLLDKLEEIELLYGHGFRMLASLTSGHCPFALASFGKCYTLLIDGRSGVCLGQSRSKIRGHPLCVFIQGFLPRLSLVLSFPFFFPFFLSW